MTSIQDRRNPMENAVFSFTKGVVIYIFALNNPSVNLPVNFSKSG